MTAALVENTIDEYHTKDGHISKSMLSDILDCPAVYKYWHVDGHKKPEKDTLNIGNAVHVLALEPSLFEARYYVLPDGVVRNAKHEKYQAQMQIAGKRTIITPNDYADIKMMAAALVADKTAQVLLKRRGVIERSIYWTDEKTGLKFKCRPDQLGDDGVVVDLKTAADVRPYNFMKAAVEYGYDMSVALTNRGYKALTGKPLENYVFLLVEKTEPNIVQAYDSFRMDKDSAQSLLDLGEMRLDKALATLIECQDTGIWPKYADEIVPLGVPLWLAKGQFGVQPKEENQP